MVADVDNTYPNCFTLRRTVTSDVTIDNVASCKGDHVITDQVGRVGGSCKWVMKPSWL